MDSALAASLADSAIIAAVVFVLAAPAIRRAPGLVLLATALAFLDDFATSWPGKRGAPLNFNTGLHWNWSGKVIDLALLLLIAAIFIASRRFTRADLGLTLRQRPGTLRAVFLVVVPFLLVIGAIAWKLSAHEVPDAETVAFQATMPGLAEELFFRGLLLALFDRMFAPTRTILGAQLGYGAIATSLAFAAVHAYGVDRSLHVSFEWMAAISPLIGAFIGAWLRTRSGSLALPILAHNAGNTITTLVPVFV